MKRMVGIRKIARFARVFRWVIVVFIVGILAWGYTFPEDIKVYWRNPYNTVNSGWTQMIDGQSYDIETVQDAIAVDIGESVVLERTIWVKEEDRHLMFYIEHQEVDVYIGDEQVYHLAPPEEMDFYGSVGKRWVEVAIPKEANGQTLRVEISGQFRQYQSMPLNMYWLKYDDIQSAQAYDMWISNTAAFVLLALAVMSYANAMIWKNKKLRRYLFAVGDLYLMIGLWLCANINLIAIIFGRVPISSILSMIFVRIIAVTFYQVCISSIREQSKWLPIIGIFAWGNLIGSLVLQFVFGISLVSQLYGYAIAVCLGSLVYLIGMVYQFITKPYTRKEQRIYYSSAILLVAVLCEAIFSLRHSIFGQYTGIAVAVGGIIHAILVHIFLVSNESVSDVQKRELEAHYKVLQKKPLTSQINAHFLGNALNSISAYCKEDPERADVAVQILAKYMREFMHLVNTGDNVSVEDELYLLELYSDLQRIRFDDSIVFEVTNEFDDFELPPLSLQPLVENAVWHGIRATIGEGVVKIKTEKFQNMGVVIISDNGVGFEMDESETYMGVSLTNIKSRIMEMGGTMHIHSRVGQGTEVVLRVPIEVALELNEEDLV